MSEDESQWLALSASEKACYNWPDDADIHRQCRAAYIAGAIDYSAAPQEVRADSAILNEIGEALECRGYAHMTNGRDIGRLLDELERLRDEPQAAPAWENLTAIIRPMIESVCSDGNSDAARLAKDIAACIIASCSLTRPKEK